MSDATRKRVEGIISSPPAVKTLKLADELDKEFTEVVTTLNKLDTQEGEDVLSFINTGLLSTNRRRNGASTTPKKPINVNSLVQGFELGQFNDIFFNERERINLYESYNQVYNLVPEMSYAANILLDNILSPDSFIERENVISYKGTDGNDNIAAMDRIKTLNKRYKAYSKLRDLLLTSIIKGDSFCAVLKYSEETSRMLTEEGEEVRPLEESFLRTDYEPVELKAKDLIFEDTELESLDAVVEAEETDLTTASNAAKNLTDSFFLILTSTADYYLKKISRYIKSIKR